MVLAAASLEHENVIVMDEDDVEDAGSAVINQARIRVDSQSQRQRSTPANPRSSFGGTDLLGNLGSPF
jgi:hypothetical protein